MKVSDLPLNELYERPKITASVEAAIQAKEDFSRISETYCEKVCKLKCKASKSVQMLRVETDILIIQDHQAPDGKFDRRKGQQETVQKSLIDFIARQAGLAGLTVRVTNLLKCPPNSEDFPKGKSPTVTTLGKCRPYLFEEIKQCKPKVIISLTTAVTKALGLNKHSNTGNRGQIVKSAWGTVVITQHPRILTMIRQNASGAFWGVDYMSVIVRDFKKAGALARGQLVVPTLLDALEKVRGQVKVAKSIEEVQEYLDEINGLSENSVISIDTETTGLDPMAEDAKLLCIQFGFRDPITKEIVARVIPLWHRRNHFFNPDDAWNRITPLLLGPRKKVAHNGKFDILYIYHTTGVRLANLAFDTMLLLHSLDSGIQGCYGLKVAVSDYLPETGLAGYEDLLPKLTKQKEETEEEQGEEEDVI